MKPEALKSLLCNRLTQGGVGGESKPGREAASSLQGWCPQLHPRLLGQRPPHQANYAVAPR